MVMNYHKKFYIKEDGVRFRRSPEITEGAKLLSQGQEIEFVDGPWVKAKLGDEEGWVHTDYITEINPNPAQVIQQIILFIKDQTNLAGGEITNTVRKIINDEYGGGINNWELQCTEYVTYRIKTKIGIDIKWPVKTGRNGGKWWKIFQDAGLYKILSEPQINCAMCFTAGISQDAAINEIGHVAFIEEVLMDGSVKVSEANWPHDGIYNERLISKSDWQNKYKAHFVDFS